MNNRQTPLESVAVVGAGPIAHIAALRLANALPMARIVIVRTSNDPAALADRFPSTLPGGWPTDVGCDEAELVSRGIATHRLGIRFVDWGEDEREWTFAHGADVILPMTGALPLLWLAHARDIIPRYEDLRPAAVLAATGRYIEVPDDRPSLLTYVDCGLRLDSVELLAMLDHRARAVGIGFCDGDVVATERLSDGNLSLLRLADGTTVCADLFVDATGPRALLAATAGEAAPGWCGCDRMLIAERRGNPSPADTLRAIELGWLGVRPLSERHVVRLAYASAMADEGHARRWLAIPKAEAINLVQPRRRPALAANALALGEAGSAIDPIGDFGFALAVRQLALFLQLLPARNIDPLLAHEFNRRAGLAAERIGTFVASLHSIRPRRHGSFWSRRQVRLPAQLSAAATAFAERGLLPQHDDQSLSDADWRAALLGLGVVPRQRDAVARSADPVLVRPLLADLAKAIATLAAALPAYPDHLAHLKDSAR